MMRTFYGRQFDSVGALEPALDGTGNIKEYKHDLPTGVRPNRHAGGPFCSFRLRGAWSESGVYAITVDDEVKYIGECGDLFARFGPTGYGEISARNCHEDGQSTNCKVNSRVLSAAKSGCVVHVWFCETAQQRIVESELLAIMRPAWNDQPGHSTGGDSDATTSKLPRHNRAARVSMDEVWRRIVLQQGEQFTQKRGGEFRYVVAGGTLRPDRTNQNSLCLAHAPRDGARLTILYLYFFRESAINLVWQLSGRARPARTATICSSANRKKSRGCARSWLGWAAIVTD